MNYLFSLPINKVIKMNRHIVRWYEWDLLVFCKQTSFQKAAIETLNASQ